MVKRIGIHFKKDSMKKKNVLLGIIIGLTTMIYSCQSDLNDTVQNISSVETPTNAVKKYVDENTYIRFRCDWFIKRNSFAKYKSYDRP